MFIDVGSFRWCSGSDLIWGCFGPSYKVEGNLGNVWECGPYASPLGRNYLVEWWFRGEAYVLMCLLDTDYTNMFHRKYGRVWASWESKTIILGVFGVVRRQQEVRFGPQAWSLWHLYLLRGRSRLHCDKCSVVLCDLDIWITPECRPNFVVHQKWWQFSLGLS